MNAVIDIEKPEKDEQVQSSLPVTKTSDSGSLKVIRSNVPETNTIFSPEYISGRRWIRFRKKTP